jgi:hypothetical protein
MTLWVLARELKSRLEAPIAMTIAHNNLMSFESALGVLGGNNF